MSVRLMPAAVPVWGGPAECHSSEGCYGSSRSVDYPLCVQDGHLESGQPWTSTALCVPGDM